MKILKSFKYIYLSIVIFVCSFNFSAFTSYATVNSDKIVQAHNGVFGSLDYSYSFHSKYFSVIDSSGIPTSTTLSPVFYFNVDSNTFDSIDGSKLVMTILNRGTGLILEPTTASAIIQAFFASITSSTYNENQNAFIQGALYDSSHNFMGYCLDDISGRYYINSNPDTITIPNETVNNVYNFYIDYASDNPEPVDFFNISACSIQTLASNYNSSSSSVLNNVMSLDSSYCYLSGAYDSSSQKYTLAPGYNTNTNIYAKFDPSTYAPVSSKDSYWNAFVSRYNVTNGTTISYADLIVVRAETIEFYLRDSEGNSFDAPIYSISDNSQQTSNYKFYFSKVSDNLITFPLNKDVTVFKNTTVRASIKNNIYTQNTYYSTTFNDYSTSNDNSFTTSVTNVDNSTTNNSTIYNEAISNFYDNSSSSYVDNTNIYIDNSTTIINNYPDPSGGGGDDPDDPDDPDSPILDTLLEKIVEFLEAIGAVIGAIISGLLGLFTNVIEALAGITELIGSIGSFMGSIFDFLPTELVSVIVAAISLCILAAVIKFIRG